MHYKKIEDIFNGLSTNKDGLTETEADERLKKYGLNEIKEEKKISPLKIFLQQFNSVVVYILIVALVISIIIGERIDAIVIGIILILNSLFGFYQEYKAEKSIEALKKLASLKATVIRGGKEREIDAKLLVLGDIIKLSEGDKIPADSRIFELANLQAQEAALTGESTPVKKELKVLAEKTPLADRINMLFSGTIVTSGKGKAIVTGTGMNSEVGKIAKLIEEAGQEETPLQKKLDHLGKWIGLLTIIISVIVFLGGILRGGNLMEFFIVAVAIAVAAIPEGLPAVVTIGLSLGSMRMVKRNALIRKLPSVETLGSTTVICSDKTGTLTKNEMTVKKIYMNNKVIDVTGSGYENKGEFLFNSKKIDAREIEFLLRVGAINNDASITGNGVIGDPTEAALIVSAAKAGIDKQILQKKYPRDDEIPFSSERKIMTTMHNMDGEHIAYTKGAPEILLELCNFIYENGRIIKLTEAKKEEILEINKEFARNALRVLGFAYKMVMDKTRAEKNLTFIGLQGMIDPPRPEAREAISKCKKAGIKVIMITGDHEITAKAIGREIGIEGKSITGAELEIINDEDFEKESEDIVIYARVNPEHKIKIVDAMKKKGHIVAMTGDGVNDAPALKKADIGISMGIAGTDVAKEASAMILTDDNFASIVNAVEEGRIIFENIKIFIKYLLIGNFAGILAIFIALIIGLPLPLLALQILWFNLVTETIPSIALTKEPPEKDAMIKKPRKPEETFIARGELREMILSGAIITIGVLGIFVYSLTAKGWEFGQIMDINNMPPYYFYATTMAFTTLVLFQLFNVYNTKSPNSSIFFEKIFNNKWLLFAVTVSVILQLAAIYTPLSAFFKTVPLTLMDWAYVVSVSSSIIIIAEAYKFAAGRLKPKLVSYSGRL